MTDHAPERFTSHNDVLMNPAASGAWIRYLEHADIVAGIERERDELKLERQSSPESDAELKQAAEILRQYRTNEAPIDSGNLYYAAMIYQEHLHTVWDARDQMMINNGLMEAIRECESLGNIIHKKEAIEAIRALIDTHDAGGEPGDMLHGGLG